MDHVGALEGTRPRLPEPYDRRIRVDTKCRKLELATDVAIDFKLCDYIDFEV